MQDYVDIVILVFNAKNMQKLNISGLFKKFIKKLYHIAYRSKAFTISPKMFDDPSISVLEF